MDDGHHRLRIADDARRDAPALFLDRDGTLIEDPGYLADPAGVRLLPGVAETLRRFRDAGHALVIVTNQSGIGRGLYGWEAYDAVAARLGALLAGEGVAVDAELACGHAPGGGVPCGWRKPEAGMIRAAADRLGLALGRSLLAGDKRIDIEAAEAAGLPRAVHVATGQGARERESVASARFGLALTLLDSLAELRPCGS
ncbi:MAG: HAD family hydrolase [Rhizobiales bacterium]|nr:HAD family hydrolase [Hyphomicrobiales bacterium]